MRLLTRSDFDGLACGALLKSLGIIDSWLFVHPKDMQDGIVKVTKDDVLANVPYVEGCGMWFDHHSSEIERVGRDKLAPGESRHAPSAARVIYDYYDGDNKIPHFKEMLKGVDKVDSGQLTADEIQNPKDWVLLGFIMDPRTGLGRFREFRISNYELMVNLLDSSATMNIDQILNIPDVKERVELYHEQSVKFKEMLKDRTTIRDNVILTDLRGAETIYAGNRFMLYSLYPEQNVSVWVVDGRGKQNCPIAVGYSVLNRTCKSDIGSLMYKYGGGGHKMVGTCQVDCGLADQTIREIVDALIEDNKS
ncbi:MAG: exopolyphosphatase [Oscillospiraceae bacterium]|nr:exopolyphosphatase [Oscillospiraceae bacterium]